MTQLTTLPIFGFLAGCRARYRMLYPRERMFEAGCIEATLNLLKNETYDPMSDLDKECVQQLEEYISMQLLEDAGSNSKYRDTLISTLANIKLIEMLEKHNLVLVLD